MLWYHRLWPIRLWKLHNIKLSDVLLLFEQRQILFIERNSDRVPVSKPVSEPVSKPVSEPVSKPVSKPVSRPVSDEHIVPSVLFRVQFDVLGTGTRWFELVIICDIIWCVKWVHMFYKWRFMGYPNVFNSQPESNVTNVSNVANEWHEEPCSASVSDGIGCVRDSCGLTIKSINNRVPKRDFSPHHKVSTHI